MKRILFAAFAAACLCASAQAQTMSAYTVASCGNQTLVAGQSFPITMNLTGDLCSSGGGGGGGGAVTAVAGAYATGSIVDLGTTADAAWSGSGNATLISVEKGIYTVAKNPLAAQSGTGVDIGGVDQIGGPWSFNETQIGGATYALGQQLAANSAPVVLTAAQITTLTPPTAVTVNPTTSASWGLGATGAAAPANGVQVLAKESGATGGYSAGLVQCDQHTFKHITSATDTLAIQGVASQTIYFCGWRARAAGVATWYFEDEADANANCSNLGSQLTGIATEAANTGEVEMSPFFNGFKGTSGHGMCIKSTGTGGVDIDYWYTQF
jgi:hypothetical protein